METTVYETGHSISSQSNISYITISSQRINNTRLFPKEIKLISDKSKFLTKNSF
jgi:hypothetical protein